MYWTEARLIQELAAYCADREFFPTAAEMEADGRRDLREAVKRWGGNVAWAQRIGRPLRPGQDRRPYGVDDATLDGRRLLAELGRLPGTVRIRELGYPRLASFIQRHCGNSSGLFARRHLNE